MFHIKIVLFVTQLFVIQKNKFIFKFRISWQLYQTVITAIGVVKINSTPNMISSYIVDLSKSALSND